MIDDEDSKIRRNVVALSFAIIAGSYVEISVTSGTLFGLNISAGHPGRVWFILAIALVYVLQRYHFSKEASELREKVLLEFAQLLSKYIANTVKKDLLGVVLKKSKPKFLMPFEGGTLLHRAERTPKVKEFTGEFYVSVSGEESVTPYKRTLELRSSKLVVNNAAYSAESGGYSVIGASFAPYELPKRCFFLLTTRAVVRFLLHSKASVDFLIPYVLAIVALGECLFKLLPFAMIRLTPIWNTISSSMAA